MKSIDHFIRSKIRRLEVQDQVACETGYDEDHVLGPFAGALKTHTGNVRFYERGLVLENDHPILYDQIKHVAYAELSPKAQSIAIVQSDGVTQHIRADPAHGKVIYATLRWIGHTRLRRTIAL